MVGDHAGVNLVDVAGADDDLEHTAGSECALQIFVIVEGLLVDLGLIRDHQTETCRAVSCCAVLEAPPTASTTSPATLA